MEWNVPCTWIRIYSRNDMMVRETLPDRDTVAIEWMKDPNDTIRVESTFVLTAKHTQHTHKALELLTNVKQEYLHQINDISWMWSERVSQRNVYKTLCGLVDVSLYSVSTIYVHLLAMTRMLRARMLHRRRRRCHKYVNNCTHSPLTHTHTLQYLVVASACFV